MTMQNLNLPLRCPMQWFGRASTYSMAGSTSMTAATQYVAFLGTFWHKDGPGTVKTVTAAEFRWGATLTFNGATVRVSLQGVSTSGGPVPRADGTILGATNSAYADLTTGSASTWETAATFGETADLTVGLQYALVVAIQSGSPTGITVSGIAGTFPTEQFDWPSVVRFDGTSTYAVQSITPNCAFLCNDGSYGMFLGGFPASALGTTALTASSNPDEVGLYWNPACGIQIEGVGLPLGYNAANADFNFNLYSDALNAGGPTDEQIDLAHYGEWGRGSANRFSAERLFLAAETFSASPGICVSVEATGAGTITMDNFDPPSSAIRDDCYGGMRMLERQNSTGAFTQSNSGLRIPLLWFIARQLSDNAGGASSGSNRVYGS